MRYFILFVDDITRFQWLFLVHKKSQVAQIFLHFEALVERKFNKKIQQLQFDGGIEFKTLQLHLFQGVYKRRITYPYTPS